MENYTAKEGKTAAIISYISIIGTLIAFVLNKDKRNYFTSFHIRQNIGINILYFANQWIVYEYIGKTVGWIFGVFIFVLWIVGFIGVLKSEDKLVPVLGEKFQEWFKNI
ncbi:hypothetical protein [uncultured Polaribacter sp.]|uniref:hypothetical protein n=1 Tax=uncultured Polaribacter sp. TaxID=174711 RepID=UPI002603EC0B|nr:hypothetical protein [uncultured Polaribacter sp.]